MIVNVEVLVKEAMELLKAMEKCNLIKILKIDGKELNYL